MLLSHVLTDPSIHYLGNRQCLSFAAIPAPASLPFIIAYRSLRSYTSAAPALPNLQLG
jgi:hypothetical protein